MNSKTNEHCWIVAFLLFGAGCPSSKWCDYVENIVDKQAGECLVNPGFFGVGLWRRHHGAKSMESLKAYIGDPAPPEIAGTLSSNSIQIADLKRQQAIQGGFNASANLSKITTGSLSPEVAKVLPNIVAGYDQNDTFDISVTLSDAKVVRYASLGQGIRRAIQSGGDGCENYVRLVKDLCTPDAEFAHSVVSAIPSVVIKTTSKKKFNTGLDVVYGDLKVSALADDSTTLRLIGTVPYVIAADWAKGEDVLGTICTEKPSCPLPSQCNDFSGQWSMLDPSGKKSGLEIGVLQRACALQGSVTTDVGGSSHIIEMTVQGSRATGFIKRTIGGCTTLMAVSWTKIDGTHVSHDVRASGCELKDFHMVSVLEKIK